MNLEKNDTRDNDIFMFSDLNSSISVKITSNMICIVLVSRLHGIDTYQSILHWDRTWKLETHVTL